MRHVSEPAPLERTPHPNVESDHSPERTLPRATPHCGAVEESWNRWEPPKINHPQLEIHTEARSNEPQTLSIGRFPWAHLRGLAFGNREGPAFRVLYAPNGLDDLERATLEQVLLELMQETTAAANGDPAG